MITKIVLIGSTHPVMISILSLPTYSDLSKKLKLVNEHKCLAFVSQLLLLLGRKCRVDGCDADLATTSVGTDWICSVQPITSEFANKMLIPRLYKVMHSVCTIIAEITGTHHQPMLLDLPSTILLSTRQFHFQDWVFSNYYDFVNLFA